MSEEERSDPFAMAASAASYVPRRATEEAFAALTAALAEGVRIVVLSGPPGLGKSVLLRRLEAGGSPRRALVSLPYAALPARDLAAWALGVLGKSGDGEPLRRLADAARESGEMVLVLDEGSAIPPEAARELAYLVGDPGSALRLVVAMTEDAKSEAVRAALGGSEKSIRLVEPMDAAETASYLATRLERAGVPPDLRGRFDATILEALHRFSRGVPRVLHRLAGEVLRRGAAALAELDLDEPPLDAAPVDRRTSTPPANPAAARVAVLEAEAALAAPSAAKAAASGVVAGPPKRQEVPAPRPPAEARSEPEMPAKAVPAAMPPAQAPRPREETTPAPPQPREPSLPRPRAPLPPEQEGRASSERAAASPSPKASSNEATPAPRSEATRARVAPIPSTRTGSPPKPSRSEAAAGAAGGERRAPPRPASRVRPTQVFLAALVVGLAAVAIPLWLSGNEAPSTPLEPVHRAPVPEPSEREPEAESPPAAREGGRKEPMPQAPAEPPSTPSPQAVPEPLAEPPAAPPAGAVRPPEVVRVQPPGPSPVPVAPEPKPADLPKTEPSPVSVAVNATPWAVIEVDGKEVGETPLAGLALAPGSYVFKAHMPDGRVLVRTVEIDAKSRFVTFP